MNMHPQQCDYDRIEVFSKMSTGKVNKHGVYCGGKAPAPITSDGNVLRVIFSSDISIQKTGFAAVFFTGKKRVYSFPWLVNKRSLVQISVRK